MKKLLTNNNLDWSATVANSSMNRKRGALGVNSYEKAIDLNILEYLEQRLKQNKQIAWLDVCCGEGNALIEVAQTLNKKYNQHNVRLDGVDLVAYYQEIPPSLKNVQFHTLPIRNWSAPVAYDLITCIHGLHYVGDKLLIIEKLLASLKKEGLFIANLDLNSIVNKNAKGLKNKILNLWKQREINYFPRKKLIKQSGRKIIKHPYTYLGADDKAGPNYTGQPAVKSYYEE